MPSHIFQRGLKYTIRHTYTVAALAGVLGMGACIGAYRSYSWFSKPAQLEPEAQTGIKPRR